MTRPVYRTRQRELIVSCLQENRHTHVTVETLLRFLRDRGEPVGQSTVYRNLERLVREGTVLKYDAPDGMCACYQILGNVRDHARHYHLVCTGCGTMSHLNCDAIDELSSHMWDNHRFALDTRKTILYGLCEQCSEVLPS